MILDFKEIPKANDANGHQDTFEFFAREFLEMMGYTIIQDPSRGPDKGKDLIVSEQLKNKETIYEIKWLVSCKHKVHSGKSIDRNDEHDIIDRVIKNNCSGFMGFYSTPSATTLSDTIYALNSNNNYRIHGLIYDPIKIERYLLQSKDKGWDIIARFFPISYTRYKGKNPGPVQIYDNQQPVLCEITKKDMFNDRSVGCVAYIIKKTDELEINKYVEYLENVIICKKTCLDAIEKTENARGNIVDFIEFDDFCNPYEWIKTLLHFQYDIQRGSTRLSNETFDKMLGVFAKTFPYVARTMTDDEKEMARHYAMLENI